MTKTMQTKQRNPQNSLNPPDLQTNSPRSLITTKRKK